MGPGQGPPSTQGLRGDLPLALGPSGRMAQSPGVAPAVRLATGGPLAGPGRAPAVARPLPAFGGWLSVPLAPGPELEGPGSSQSCPWGARRAVAGPCRALGPSRGVARGDGPRRWGARTPGRLLGNGFQAAQRGEGVGVCGETERQVSGRPRGSVPTGAPRSGPSTCSEPPPPCPPAPLLLGEEMGLGAQAGSSWGRGSSGPAGGRAPLPGTRPLSVPD